MRTKLFEKELETHSRCSDSERPNGKDAEKPTPDHLMHVGNERRFEVANSHAQFVHSGGCFLLALHKFIELCYDDRHLCQRCRMVVLTLDELANMPVCLASVILV